ncbi:hypothetical protein M6B38_318865 [Iris pallida]|uniref:Uncharacterized protein n=1 Tax=Iris pallida TaxID=29817 RepID=A0AAX6HD92_IRIPA|nr:hypothetical protein M6B38_318865 [Iris pallida]
MYLCSVVIFFSFFGGCDLGGFWIDFIFVVRT